MSEADKMFEKLGYKLEKDTENNKFYTLFSKNIVFISSTKNVQVYETYTGKFEEISIEELKAINKKCEELRWI